MVCSMIIISDNAAPENFLVVNPQCNCKKQEYQEFHPITIMICDISMIGANVGILLKEMFFQV